MKSNREQHNKAERLAKARTILTLVCLYALINIFSVFLFYMCLRYYLTIPGMTVTAFFVQYANLFLILLAVELICALILYVSLKCFFMKWAYNKVTSDYSKELVEKNFTYDVPKKVNLTYHCEFFAYFDQSMDTIFFYCCFNKEKCLDIIAREEFLSYAEIADNSEFYAVLSSRSNLISVYRKFQIEKEDQLLASITKKEFTTYCQIAEE